MEPTATVLDPIAQTALRSLKDIVVPAPVSWMPQTWGWAILAAVLIAGLIVLMGLQVRRYRANAYRREALTVLARIEGNIGDPGSHKSTAAELALLLKRTALAAWPRQNVAKLSQKQWAEFLRSHGDYEGALAGLVDGLEYRGSKAGGVLRADEYGDLVAATRKWIEGHNVPA